MMATLWANLILAHPMVLVITITRTCQRYFQSAQHPGKQGFLKDIPRTLSYILDLEQDYPELTALCRLIDELIMPGLQPGDSGCTP